MKVHGANMLDNVKPETLEKVENYLVQSNGRLTYRTLILEIVPEILCLDLKQVSGSELVGANYQLYCHVKEKTQYPELLKALRLCVPSDLH